MELSFYKMRILGDDLILVDADAQTRRQADWRKVAKAMCDRRRGCGANSLVVISRSPDGKRVRAWLPDGREARPRPDILLCAARYFFDAGMSDSPGKIQLLHRDGEATVDALDSESFGMGLGPPLDGEGRPLSAEALRGRARVRSSEGSLEALRVYLGRPYAIVFAEGRGRLRRDERRAAPPALVLARPVSRGELGASLSWGPGFDACEAAAAACSAAFVLGMADRSCCLSTRYGMALVEYSADGRVYAAAPASYAFRGEFHAAMDDEALLFPED